MVIVRFPREVREFTWNAYEPRAALLCLPALILTLVAGVATGHSNAAMVMSGGAQSAGFGSFQKPLWFRGGAMLVSTIGMAVSATLGCLLARHAVALVLICMLWAFVYGMVGAISAPAQWVGQQCCTFLVVSSAFPSTLEEAGLRGLGVLVGGLLQSGTVALLWNFVPAAKSSIGNLETHPPGWRQQALRANLTLSSPVFHYALRLVFIAALSVIIYRVLNFPNAYWIPMTALIVPKPDRSTTVQRDVARVLGTIVGAGVATLLAVLAGNHIWVPIVMVGIFMWAAYALQNVNYAAFVVVLTGYIAFSLAIGKQPEALTAVHRVVATTLGGLVAMLAYLVHLNILSFWPRSKQVRASVV